MNLIDSLPRQLVAKKTRQLNTVDVGPTRNVNGIGLFEHQTTTYF